MPIFQWGRFSQGTATQWSAVSQLLVDGTLFIMFAKVESVLLTAGRCKRFYRGKG
jgi:hypothetical protein